MGAIIKFPKVCRPHPPAEPEPLAVHVLRTEGPEYWVIVDDQGWLHGDLRSALREAVDLADELNISIQLDR